MSNNWFKDFHIIRQAFHMFDSNNDGYIDMKELQQVSVLLGTMLNKEELEEFMGEADKVENENELKEL